MMSIVEKFNLNNVIPKEKTVSILAGCNGLLLLQGCSSSDDFYVSNRATRQYTVLPHPKEPCLNHIVPFTLKCRWAIFYNSSVERYGVFAIWEKHVIMLTSGDKQWKYHIFPKHDAYCQLTSIVFAQRELHWLACHNSQYEHDKYICSLDVGNMGFKMIKLPTSEAECNLIFLSCENKESLCVATVFQDHLDVWGLADKGNNPWTKQTSITLQSLSKIPNFWVGMCIVGIKEDIGSNVGVALKLIIPQGDKLLYHDLKSRELKKISNITEGFRVTRPGQFHVDSLVSWHPTKAMGKRKRVGTRFKLTATKDCNQLIANDYIELRNKRKIPRRCQ
ncbi:hypothetical protein FRX31_033534 [Thalictrum thalictroides]|uniref:F-box associated beta-propeller type 3 domain-containing protein n=1 Tax=Thalictrum thalictroides TaxID=46969 RepID=A0A7J6UWR0_THATH|nr:hypothetical protein FRX31_033534 [Thalictrum thalictroides]